MAIEGHKIAESYPTALKRQLLSEGITLLTTIPSMIFQHTWRNIAKKDENELLLVQTQTETEAHRANKSTKSIHEWIKCMHSNTRVENSSFCHAFGWHGCLLLSHFYPNSNRRKPGRREVREKKCHFKSMTSKHTQKNQNLSHIK